MEAYNSLGALVFRSQAQNFIGGIDSWKGHSLKRVEDNYRKK